MIFEFAALFWPSGQAECIDKILGGCTPLEKYILRNILWTIIDVMMFIEVTVIHFIREVLGEMEMEVQKIDLRGTK